MMHYFPFIRPFLFCLPSEFAHNLAIFALRYGLVPKQKNIIDATLKQRIWDMDFNNPLGLAAGFDKNADGIPGLRHQGFGFIEVGTLTPKPQPGNQKPRLFRLKESQAIINRMGFNNKGIDHAIEQIRHLPQHGIIGINIGKNKTSEDASTDYITGLEKAYPHAQYITINISSPNTAGLRDLQSKSQLKAFLEPIVHTHNRCKTTHNTSIPLLLKIAPDLDKNDIAHIVEVVLDLGIDGLIVSNTTISRDNISHPLAKEQGGLSGKPLFDLATQTLRSCYALSEGKLTLIGVGGISSAQEAYQKIRAGASLLQLYSTLIYQGFSVVNTINKELITLLKQDGFTHISEAVGIDAKP